jgi:hypothetical protein
MASDPKSLGTDLAAVLAKHGVTGLPASMTTAAAGTSAAPNPGVAASYIREIITSDQAFDEGMLSRVASVLSKAGS